MWIIIFGNIFLDIPTYDNLVFIGGDFSPLPNVKFEEFIQDTVNFINKNKIKIFCFHPLDSYSYKNSLKSKLKDVHFYKTFVDFKKSNLLNNYYFISISSTGCFDLLINGISVSFAINYFKSINKDPNTLTMKKYFSSIKTYKHD